MRALFALTQWLVLPVLVLLALQWPLRDLVGAYSTLANDVAQACFALYVAAAVTLATRSRAHLSAELFADRANRRRRRQLRLATSVLVLLPWALLMLASSAPMGWRALSALERFPETGNPGYFVVKIALVLLLLLVALQAIRDLLDRGS